MKEWQKLALMVGVFLLAFFLPLDSERVMAATLESWKLLQWYARKHTLACVVPALFIAGAIATFLSKQAVLKYLGPKANKLLAYSVASVSGTVLSVCSCSVLPMFAGIYRLGAGIGPASAFLYSGPAINVMAILLTARVLGYKIGLGRALGAVVFAFVVGWLMALVFGRGEEDAPEVEMKVVEDGPTRPLWKTASFLVCMILFIVFSDWFNPGNVVVTLKDGGVVTGNVRYDTATEVTLQVYDAEFKETKGELRKIAVADIDEMKDVENWVVWVHHNRWYFAAVMGIIVLIMTFSWFSRDEIRDWMDATWDFTKMIVPLLFGGVFAVGFISALIPDEVVAGFVGTNSLGANAVASVLGAAFYFATLTEVPIVQSLLSMGMHPGPAMSLLLAGPALSIPSILVLATIMGWKRTLAFLVFVVVMATAAGMIFGATF